MKKKKIVLLVLLILLILAAGVALVFKFVINNEDDTLKTGATTSQEGSEENNLANVNEEQTNTENNLDNTENTNNETNSEVANNTNSINNNETSDKNNNTTNTQSNNNNTSGNKTNNTTSGNKTNNTTSGNKTNNQSNNNSSTNKNQTSTQNNKPTTSSGFKSDINKVSLNPMITRYPELDSKVGSVVNSVVKGNMSNYDKLAALYNYVKNKLSYKASGIYMNDVIDLIDKYHYSYNDAMQLISAKGAMDTGTGVCDDYSALFMILARRVGFDAYVINGQAPNQTGGRGGHVWVLIRANGKNYFCDPQIEDYNKTKYNLFGKTESQVKNMYSSYSISNSINSFNYFREQSPITTNTTISGALSKNIKQTTYTSDYKSEEDTIKVGDKLTVSTNSTNCGSVEYSIKITEGGKNVVNKSGTGKGEKITVDYTFKKEGNAEIYVWIRSSNGSTEYSLDLTVEDESKIKHISSCATKLNSGTLKLTFTTEGGYAPYTYKMELLETDATKDYSIDDSNSTKYITPGNGTYFKIKVTVTDSKGTTFSQNYKYDVASNKLTRI